MKLKITLVCSVILATGCVGNVGVANAAIDVTYTQTLSPSVAAATHPSITAKADFDRSLADSTGDDVAQFSIGFGEGLKLGTAAVSSTCTTAQHSTDTCPSGSYVGSVTMFYRRSGTDYTATGSIYVITPTAGKIGTLGLVLRPSGYQKVKLAGELTYELGNGSEKRLTETVANVPKKLLTTGGVQQDITIDYITQTFNARTGSPATGSYFTLSPSDCFPTDSKLSATSFLGASDWVTLSWTPSNCPSVVFSSTTTVGPTNTSASAPVGIGGSVSFQDPDAATVSTAEELTVDMPLGTSVSLTNMASIAAAACSLPSLYVDTCSSTAPTSDVGNVSGTFKYGPHAGQAFTGDVYATGGTSGSLDIALVFRGSGGLIFVTTPSSIQQVDLNSDTVFDTVRLTLRLPRHPLLSLSFSIPESLALVTNPTACGSSSGSWAWSTHSGASESGSFPVTYC